MKAMIVTVSCLLMSAGVTDAAIEKSGGDKTEMAALSLSRQVQTKAADICIPPEPQIIPRFIRNSGGTIVGINYMIIEYTC